MAEPIAYRRLFKAVCALAIMLSIVFSMCPAIALAEEELNAKELSTHVRIGYYSGEEQLQDGFSDDERKSGYAYDLYQELADLAGWEYDYIYGTREEIMQALERGDVDIVAGVYDNEEPEGTVLLSQDDLGLPDYPRYFAVNKDRPDLLTQLNIAFADLKEASPNFLNETLNTYYSSPDASVSLTEGELAWLQKHGTIKVGYLTDNLPISGQDEDGTPSGLSSIVMSDMGTYFNVKIEPVPFDSFTEMRDALIGESVDAILPIYADQWISESRGIRQTAPYISDRPLVAFMTKSENMFAKIAVNDSGLGQGNFVTTNYPNSEILYFPSREDALNAVQKGEANCALGPASVLTRYITASHKYKDLQTAYIEGTEYYAIGSRLSEPIMARLLKKFVAQLDSSKLNNAMIIYSYVQPDYSFTAVLQRYSLVIISIVLVLLFGILFMFHRYRVRVEEFNMKQQATRQALEDALVVANSASEAKTAFLSNMSHDIRTPMNGIIGMTAIAAANIDNKARVEDCLGKIASSGKHLLALINEILDVSKIESGKFELSEEVFKLSDMLDDLLATSKPMMDAKDIKLSVRVDNISHEDVNADRTRLQQVFMNLVGNAIKYTLEGGSIDIALSEKPSGSPTVACYEFTVKDTGIGMSKEFLPTIFDAFARADDTRARKEQGTGLGMPIALSIARMMNGDITVESEVGKGSTFTVTVFLKIAKTVLPTYEEFIDLNVLVVDDDEDACLYTCTLLDSLGMKPEYVLSGEEAVALVESRFEAHDNFFAIILDWIMPDMDGLAVIKELRAHVPEHIPIIIVSAYDWEEIEYEARQAGVEFFVSKPLFKSRLANLFEQIIGIDEEKDTADLTVITEDKPLEGKRALLAEDNDLNAEIAINFLNMAGMEIDRVVNGKAAIEKVKENELGYYDCVFMDIQMPIMDGYDAARAIRALEREDAKDLPIFAMTANAFVDDVRESAEAGMNEHFAKPLDFEKIIAVVHKYMKS